MEYQSPSKKEIILKNGLYYGVVSLALAIASIYGNMQQNLFTIVFSYIIVIVAIVLGLRQYRMTNQGFLKFGQGLGIGTLIISLGGFITSIFYYILYVYIDPAKYQEIIAVAQESTLRAGLTDSQMDLYMKILDFMMAPLSISVIHIIGSVFIGLIFSLIISAIMKKDPEPEF